MKSHATTLLLLLSSLLAINVRAAEPWVDPGLEVLDGLEVWLDAHRQVAARQALGLPTIESGSSLDQWLDGSGKKRHVVQKNKENQPTYRVDSDRAAVRFDGKKQALGNGELKASYRDSTIFIVATPFSNSGGFRAFAAINANGRDDFTSGWTIDMGPFMTERFETLNPEGIGFGGAGDLHQGADDFGILQRICVTTTIGKNGTRFILNGKPQGSRSRAESKLTMDRLTIGARFYANAGTTDPRGFLEGEIYEVIIYSRILSDDELRKVDEYLAKKHGNRRKVAIPPRRGVGRELTRIKNPPPVQIFVPGFTAEKLPHKLPNINNVRYRADGKLVALAYNGDIYLLSDRDKDGIEEHVETFFESQGKLRSPIGMALTPEGYKHGRGVFVASKGKCSLIVDKDGDDKADEEIVVAKGWNELFHGVDALGVAVDPRDHSIYFGLGTTNFTNAYLIEPETGKAKYSLTDEHGTIMRISPDFKNREIVCTGIRFPVGLEFNQQGDLFCTDQEGATWLANGNPFDELLHIERGRHYGFPPRHPRHLPNVIDEPSVFDYRPQHQSTCGLFFNPTGANVFGPESWKGNAIVCGYSRGKLFRTELVKTEQGYIARNQLLGCCNELAVDACVSPAGDLIVSTHTGAPDWGSGPQGTGTLHKVRYAKRDVPQPTRIWAQGPHEIRIAFDRPVSLSPETSRPPRVEVDYGEAVSAGDRFESLRPGYQVVADQLDLPRELLPVHSIQILPDQRTLVLSTSAMTQPATYAVKLNGFGGSVPVEGKPVEEPAIDLEYDLSGVAAEWRSADGTQAWSGWLPHLSLAIAQAFTTESANHDQLWSQIGTAGQLTLKTQLRLRDMLRPAVQPGARIDYPWPEEHVTVYFRSNREFKLSAAGKDVVKAAESDGSGHFTAQLVSIPKEDEYSAIELVIPTGSEPLKFDVWWTTQEDNRPRALAVNRVILPWVKIDDGARRKAEPRKIPQLEGGNWSRGRQVFLGDQAGCSKCHQFGGLGGKIGPDLSNLPLRDYESVLRDITQPSAAFNPDFLPYTIVTTDGRVMNGTVRQDGDHLVVGDTAGKVTTVARAEIESMTPSSVSIMPEGIVKQLGEEKLRDLLTFLLTNPPQMPDYGAQIPPPPRSRAEVEQVLAGAEPPVTNPREVHVVLVAGRKDHGPGEHDYPAWQRAWERLFALAENVKVTSANDWPSKEQLDTADVLVFYQQGTWNEQRARDLDAFFDRGGGAVYLHYAVDGGQDAEGFAKRIGLAWRGGHSLFRHGELDIDFKPGGEHPIARNFDQVHFHDESYWRLLGDRKRINLLGTGVEQSEPQPLFWTSEPGKGRVFVSILGHFSWTFDDPLFRILVLRGIAWSAKEPVDRFRDLAIPGARVQ